MPEKVSAAKLGANIARLRRKCGYTQTALAEKLYVSNKTVSKWERGAGYPEITQLIGLAKLFGTSIENIIMGERFGIAFAGNMLTDSVKLAGCYPEKGMLATVYSVSQAVGGCVPNTAIDLAKIDPELRISAYGRIGNDDAERYLIGELQRHGIDVGGVKISSTSGTSFSDVMTVKSTGERTFFHYRGANSEFSPQDIKISDMNCEMLHIGYILLLDEFDKSDDEYGTAMARFLSEAQKAGIRTSIDVVSSSDGSFAEKVAPALKYTDNAIMNEIEGSGISGLAARDENGKLIFENIKKTMRVIFDYGVSERVILHCPEAGFCLEKDGKFTVVPSLDLPKGYIKGTVGAGDAFCAGCLYGIYNDWDAEQILTFAAGAAACNLSAEDSVSGMKDKKTIFELAGSMKNTKIKFEE